MRPMTHFDFSLHIRVLRFSASILGASVVYFVVGRTSSHPFALWARESNLPVKPNANRALVRDVTCRRSFK